MGQPDAVFRTATRKDWVARRSGVGGNFHQRHASFQGWDTRFEIFGQTQMQEQQARTNFVNSEYFSVLHIPLAGGRFWTHDEIVRGARMAVVNQTLAQRYWPRGNAVGQQIRLP